ncbi:hypothetical protein AB6A40_005205 [Gnathostoma spinigerum]|uniref:WD repeat-containing protein 75 n=1 Tax=Gnathostoma spinigerum TaxID=75299 RepID=A0ABD6EH07_9BILA
MTVDSWKFTSPVGFNLGDAPITFSTQNKKIFAVSGKSVIVFDSNSGKREKVLEHDSSVIDTHFLPPDKLITYSVGGQRREWNIDTYNSVTFDKPDKILSLLAVKQTEKDEVLFVSLEDDKTIIIYKGKWKDGKVDLDKVGETSVAVEVNSRHQISTTSEFFVYCNGKSVKLHLFNSDQKGSAYRYTGKVEGIPTEKIKFTSVTAREDTIAAALSFGRVMIWKDVGNKGLHHHPHSIHWHKTAPSMILTPFGSLISGGGEGVLAKFSSVGESNRAQFLPRMLSPIYSLSVSDDGSTIAAVLADNSLHLVLISTMTVLKSMQSVLVPRGSPLIPMALDPLHPNLIVRSGRPGTLQWIDNKTWVTVATADVTCENLPDADNELLDSKESYRDVSAVFIGKIMIMTAERLINTFPSECRVRFWRRQGTLGALALEDTVQYNGDISMLRGGIEQSVNQRFLSFDLEGRICCWQRDSEKALKWRKCSSAHWKKTYVLHASYIRDPFIPVVHKVGNGGVLVVWDVVLLQQLCIFSGNGLVTMAEWDPDPYSMSVLVTCHDSIVAFSLDSLSPTWIVMQPGLSLGTSITTPVVFIDTRVVVFDPESGRLRSEICANGSILNVVASTVGHHGIRMTVLTIEGFLTISNEDSDADTQNAETLNCKQTPFSKLVYASLKEKKQNRLSHETPSLLKLVSGPAPSLAPIPHLAPTFIRSCFLPPS